jgi:hypothetical protein
MNTQVLDQAQIHEIVQEWRTTLNHLIEEISGWVQEQPGWSVQPISQQEVAEEALGRYTAPVLTIDTPEGRLILEPMARMGFGSKGIVELYAWPTLYRVRLIQRPPGEGWDILTDSGIKLRQPWNRETFVTLAQDLLGAE